MININPQKIIPIIKEKKWGKEIWMVNNEKYCGKLLCFNKESKFSMHFHILKDESWYVNKGKFIFKYINGENADIIEEILNEGDCVRIPQYLPHQLEVLSDGGEIIEISTQHFEEDSIRIIKGDSQLK